MSERAGPSIGASILAGGRAGLRVENLLAEGDRRLGWQACGAAPQLEWRESETLGLVPAAGALALVACGQSERAEDVLSQIPLALSEQEPARSLIAAARQAMLTP